MVGEKTAGPSRSRPARRLGLRAAAAARRRAAPAEDDEVGALLPDRLDHAVGGMPADADHGPDLDSLLVTEVEHALQQAARGARLGGALGQGDALRHLHDAERGDLGGSAVAHAGADAHQVARRARVGERQQDAVRRAASGGIRVPGRRGAHLLPARHQVGLELLELASLGVDHPLRLVGGHLQRLADEPRGAPEVERRQRGEQLLAIRARAVEGDQRVVQAADPELGREVERWPGPPPPPAP